MLKEKAVAYYRDDDRNCAEAILMAANDVYKLGLSPETIHIIGGFGGGMGCGDACGALSGAVAVLSAMDKAPKAHESETLKADCAALAAAFEAKLGSTRCDVLTPKYKTEADRCVKTVQLAAEVLADFLKKRDGGKEEAAEMPTADQIKAVKGQGFLHCKGTDKFNARVITRNGKITADEAQTILNAARLYGNGEMAFTTRLTVEVQQIPYKNIADFQAELAKAGLATGGTGSKVRPVVSCKGTTCQYGLADTYALSEKIHQQFYLGYRSVLLPHKFKIAVGGCPNNCVKPSLNDLGIVGQRVPVVDLDKCRGCKVCQLEKACPIHVAHVENGKVAIDPEVCKHCGRCVGKCPFHVTDQYINGYRVYLGGRWGKNYAHGIPMDTLFTDEAEVLSIVEKAILLFRDQGVAGERFSDTIERIGFETACSLLEGDDLLTRKDEILSK